MTPPAPRTAAASTPSPTIDLAVQRERKLVEAAKKGDGKAFAALVRPHLPVLYRLAARACGDASLAEDAVQEALDLAYQRLDRYEPGTSMRAFLASMAVRRAACFSSFSAATSGLPGRTGPGRSASRRLLSSPPPWLWGSCS